MFKRLLYVLFGLCAILFELAAKPHYTQFMVYELDSDGRAELVCKTADGTKDGLGNVIGNAKADWRDTVSNSPTVGRILKGPEYLTVFDGLTGKALSTVDYLRLSVAIYVHGEIPMPIAVIDF